MTMDGPTSPQMPDVRRCTNPPCELANIGTVAATRQSSLRHDGSPKARGEEGRGGNHSINQWTTDGLAWIEAWAGLGLGARPSDGRHGSWIVAPPFSFNSVSVCSGPPSSGAGTGLEKEENMKGAG